MAKYQLAIDADKLVAIDVHVHAQAGPRPTESGAAAAPKSDVQAAAAKYFRLGDGPPPTIDETAEYYRERKMACCIFGGDPKNSAGRNVAMGTLDVLEAAGRHPDVFLPFANVDPKRLGDAVSDAQKFIEMGVRGFKFHPPGGGYWANDKDFYPLYQVLNDAKIPALFHTGQSGMGAGARGGGGYRLKYGNPLHLDDLAVDFPDMPIIMAHPSWPWQEEALAIAAHKPTCYIDLSGWSPKYFPPQLVQYSNTMIKDKVLMGSDYPLIMPDRWLADFAQQTFKDEVRPKILKENAIKLFGLS
jgi:predicted TIM-barrel fold metal-dependent hydrolase